MTVLGTDISSNQHPPWRRGVLPADQHRLDFTAAANAGVQFVIIKATQGATYQNPYFPQDVADARAAGLTVGAYHWVSPTTAAGKQIGNFLATTRVIIRPGDLPAALDFEQAGATHALLDAVRAGLRGAGLMTMTYTYPDFWAHNGSSTCAACASDPLWWASYAHTMAPAPKPWAKPAIWQYAGTSVPIPGVGAKEDANQALVPLAQLTGAPTPPPVQEDTMAEFLARNDGDARWYHVVTSGGPSKRYVPNQDLANVLAFSGVLTEPGAQPFVWDPAAGFLDWCIDITTGTKPAPQPVKKVLP